MMAVEILPTGNIFYFRLMKFIDNLTNWYVRTNRKRLKGEATTLADSRQALVSFAKGISI